ncbi:cdc42 effector protein 1b [Boleophthalmus pectinirostris]|uniref:cdc42 effector protein 1b n=1 Tax=Boleophthalmus pectinirostris TaxID=150288 RepID=UPI000A1C1AE7|nr:cdc42 effector protein 1b [Boleophthalmus pectinirostris]
MSLAKLPGIKGLVSSSQAKRRFKSDLSVDMIGPPMGDFRHTMHVGRGGDVFGDTSFLSNYGGGGFREPSSPDSTTSRTGFFTRKFKHVRKNSAPRTRGGSRDLSSPPPEVSPIIKNAISLPQLNMVDSASGCLQRAVLTTSFSSTDDALCTYGYQSGFVTLPRLSRMDRPGPDGESCRGSLPRSDSLTSFTLDLGPSLMTEVLSMIDIHSCLQTSNQSPTERQGEGQEDEEDEDSETPVQSPEVLSPEPSVSMYSRHMHSRGRCSGSDFTQPQEFRRSVDLSECGMQAESFQRAAHVLSRHYGGASFTHRSRGRMSPVCNHDNTSPVCNHNNMSPVCNHDMSPAHSKKSVSSSSEDEEEIKV